MIYQSIRYEVKGPAAWITLNRPGALNSIDGAMLVEVPDAIAKADQDDAVHGIILTGAGRAFCAGADLKNLLGIIERKDSEEIRKFFQAALDLFISIIKCRKPVIAAVNGVAAAGGIEFIQACDLVYAVEDAKIGDAHVNFGVIPGGGGTINLPRKIGPTRAKELLFTGDLLPARQLMEWGLINDVVADQEALYERVSKLVEKIASKSPLVIRRMKELVDDGLDAPLDRALAMEVRAWEAHGQSQDLAEGLNAFVEKRIPNYTGK